MVKCDILKLKLIFLYQKFYHIEGCSPSVFTVQNEIVLYRALIIVFEWVKEENVACLMYKLFT